MIFKEKINVDPKEIVENLIRRKDPQVKELVKKALDEEQDVVSSFYLLSYLVIKSFLFISL